MTASEITACAMLATRNDSVVWAIYNASLVWTVSNLRRRVAEACSVEAVGLFGAAGSATAAHLMLCTPFGESAGYPVGYIAISRVR